MIKKMLLLSGIVSCLAFLGGCYSQGNSHFLSNGEIEYFLTMNRCEEEAKARYSDGSPKYSGYECRSMFLWFTLEKRDFHSGEVSSSTG